jgi:hypothetical protein
VETGSEPREFWGRISPWECGVIGGRLTGLMAKAVRDALTEEAVMAVLNGFKREFEEQGSKHTH